MLKAGYQYQPGDQIVTPGVVYRVEKELGKGGVGCTYKAINKSLNAPCVVKVMLPTAAVDRAACERFQREAQMKSTATSNLRVRPSLSPWHIGIQGDF